MLDTFALAGLLGLNVEKMLNGTSFDLRLRELIVERARVLRSELDLSLSQSIIGELAAALKRGQS